MRVIAGDFGGRRLKVPKGRETRPTSDRVREAIFSSLGPLSGFRALDLFAGSGALGIEALSRGAERVCFVERNKNAVRVIRENLADLELSDRSDLMIGDVSRALRRLERGKEAPSFDLVFVDPPYQSGECPGVLAALLLGGLLAAGAVVVVECPGRTPLVEPAGYERRSERHYGDTVVVQLVVPTSSAVRVGNRAQGAKEAESSV